MMDSTTTTTTRKGSLRSSGHPRARASQQKERDQAPAPLPLLPTLTPHKIREVYKVNLCKRIQARKVLWKGNQVGRAKDADRAWTQVAKQIGGTAQEVKKDFSSVKKSLQNRIERALKNGSVRPSSWEEINLIVNDEFKNRCLPKLWSELPWLGREIATQILKKDKKRRARSPEPTQQSSQDITEGCVDGPPGTGIAVAEEEGGNKSKPVKRGRKPGNGKKLAKKKAENQLPVTTSMPEEHTSAFNDNHFLSVGGVKDEMVDENDEEERHWRRMGPPVVESDMGLPYSAAGGAGNAAASIPSGSSSAFPVMATPLAGYGTLTPRPQQLPQQFPNHDQVNSMYNPNPGNFSIQGGGCFPVRSSVSELTDYTISMLEKQYYLFLGMVDSEIANYVHVLARKIIYMPQPARRRQHIGPQVG